MMIIIKEALTTVIVTHPDWWVSRMAFSKTRNRINICVLFGYLMLQILLMKAITIISINGSIAFLMTSPTRIIVYGFILDINFNVFIYITPIKRCLNCFSMTIISRPTFIFIKDYIITNKCLLRKWIIQTISFGLLVNS